MTTLLHYSYSESLNLIGSLLTGWHNYNGTAEVLPEPFITPLKEKGLTNLCMQISEKSLAKVWENEDDEYWESYLKD